jgi:hypothetical protein
MADFILIDGDIVNFVAAFTPAVVAVRPGNLTASGPNTLNGKKVCIDGDEKSVAVESCSYMTPAFPIAGMGTLKIQKLGGDQTATKTNSGNKPMLLKGSMFTAVFEVQSPAKQPPPPISGGLDDPMKKYMGNGSFQTANTKYQGT